MAVLTSSQDMVVSLARGADGSFVFSTGQEELNLSPDGINDIYSGSSATVAFPRNSWMIPRIDLFKALAEKKFDKEVVGISQLKECNEWSVTFSSPEVRKARKIVVNGIVGHIRDPDAKNIIYGRIFWLPLQFPDAIISAALGHFGTLIDLERETAEEPGISHLLSGVRSFTLKLADGVTKEDLPQRCLLVGQAYQD